MSACTHKTLCLLPEQSDKLRCVHCHLVISPNELRGGFCPECYESGGVKRYDFEPVEHEKPESTRYRCDACGIVIEC